MMRVIVMMMMVVMMVITDGRAASFRRAAAAASKGCGASRACRAGQERTPLDPHEPRADRRDEREAGKLDIVHGATHGRRRHADQACRDTDHRDRHQGLQHGGGERQDHPAPPRLLVGHQVGGDHRLAVPRAGGVEDPVGERQTEQRPHGAAVSPGRANRGPQPEIELRLLRHDPADDAVRRRRRRCRGRPTDPERRALRERRIERAQCQSAQRHGGRDGSERQDQYAGMVATRARHGHVTAIRLANCAP